MVDSGRTAGTVLELSHWPGNKTPQAFKADTSTEIALNYIASDQYFDYLEQAEWVSSDHYDIDGLLSVWVLTQGKKVLDDFDFLVDVATMGDFDHFISEKALKTCLTLTYFEEDVLQKCINQSTWDTDYITRFLYNNLFSFIPECFEEPDLLKHLWEDKFRKIMNDRVLIQSDRVKIQEYPEYDLAIVLSDVELSDYAVNEVVDSLNVLCIWDQHYVWRYRYESFVEITSRVAKPRVSPQKLITKLNELEQNEGTWFCENIVTAHPKLQLYNKQEVPAKSSIKQDKFVWMVLDHLEQANQGKIDIWHNSHGWDDVAGIPLPPSKIMAHEV